MQYQNPQKGQHYKNFVVPSATIKATETVPFTGQVISAMPHDRKCYDRQWRDKIKQLQNARIR